MRGRVGVTLGPAFLGVPVRVGRAGDAATVDAEVVVVAGMGGSLIVAVTAVIVRSFPGTGARRVSG